MGLPYALLHQLLGVQERALEVGQVVVLTVVVSDGPVAMVRRGLAM